MNQWSMAYQISKRWHNDKVITSNILLYFVLTYLSINMMEYLNYQKIQLSDLIYFDDLIILNSHFPGVNCEVHNEFLGIIFIWKF